MNNTKKLGLFSLLLLGLSACQSTPQAYNGVTGYQIESRSENSATLAYTLAVRSDQTLDEKKLLKACQKVLGTHQNYKISVLSVNEIINPALNQHPYGVQIGQSRTAFELSNTPSLNNSQDYATRQALETKPATLRVVRYTCS
ncbi:hypothetical protein [Acinetobacter sp. CAAS 2-6]|uniref:hypothetical protein n=1 Tax=Acinetobacter sp. CAAS 2-6 TaxID=3016358 RepID=UPI002DD64734|nr:hypothetical protein [Acinetobacter sp. CAAS 2-6]